MKLLVWGDSPAVATGFGNVNRIMLTALKKAHPEIDITIIGINDRGGYKDPAKYPFKIYPAIYDDPRDVFGVRRLLGVLSKQDPEIKEEFDVLFCNYDFYLLNELHIGEHRLLDYIANIVPTTTLRKTVLHTPVDHELIYKEWGECLKWFDKLVVPSNYGKEVFAKHETLLGRNTEVVYHGFDVDNFHRLKEKEIEEIKKKMGIDSKFVIGFVGRNNWRKDFYHLAEIFARFKEKHSDAFLYLHCKPTGMEMEGYDIFRLMSQYGLVIGKDYMVPGAFNESVGIDRVDMNAVYNIMDVHLSASVGEGFGMPMVEAMLCGVPNVVPNNTTVPELMNSTIGTPLDEVRGLVYDTSNKVVYGQFDHLRARPLADTDSAVAKLEFIYDSHNKEIMKGITDRAEIWARTLTAEKQAEEIYKIIKLSSTDIAYNKRKKNGGILMPKDFTK